MSLVAISLAKLPQVMNKSVQFIQTSAVGAFQDLPQRIEWCLRAV